MYIQLFVKKYKVEINISMCRESLRAEVEKPKKLKYQKYILTTTVKHQFETKATSIAGCFTRYIYMNVCEYKYIHTFMCMCINVIKQKEITIVIPFHTGHKANISLI